MKNKNRKGLKQILVDAILDSFMVSVHIVYTYIYVHSIHAKYEWNQSKAIIRMP